MFTYMSDSEQKKALQITQELESEMGADIIALYDEVLDLVDLMQDINWSGEVLYSRFVTVRPLLEFIMQSEGMLVDEYAAKVQSGDLKERRVINLRLYSFVSKVLNDLERIRAVLGRESTAA